MEKSSDNKQKRKVVGGNMVKYSAMKLIALSLLLPFAATAARVELPSVPGAEWADTESETNVVFCAGAAKDDKWEFSIELDAAQDNCVEVVFGTDADGDGALGIEEGEFSVGWDCGEWFVRDRKTGSTLREECAAGRRRLQWTVSIDSMRRVKSWEGNVFHCDAPKSCFSPAWNMARVVAGGASPVGERITSLVCAQGFSVRVR